MRTFLPSPVVQRLQPSEDEPLLSVPKPSPTFSPRLLTLTCDGMVLLVTIGITLLFYVLTLLVWPPSANPLDRELIEWMPGWTLISTALWFMGVDSWNSLRPTQQVPFDHPEPVVRQIYRQRLETLWWAIAAHLVLLCLCLLLTGKPFISKLFLSLIVALAALAARKSIADHNLAFAVSTSIFSGAMLIITIANAVSN